MSHLLDLTEVDFTYVNVHTAKYPLGAIRGQIRTCPREERGDKSENARINIGKNVEKNGQKSGSLFRKD